VEDDVGADSEVEAEGDSASEQPAVPDPTPKDDE
jgi:hypothetical protein